MAISPRADPLGARGGIMAHESHYSSQFLLGVSPLMQGLDVEAGNSGLLGVDMLEDPSSKLLESANTAAGAWPPPGYSSSSSPMSLFGGSKQTSMKISLSLLNTSPPSALQPELIHHHHHRHQQQQLFDLKSSMYLRAARELLIECCSLERGSSSRERLQRASHWENELERPPTASYSMNHLELHSLKTKLFSMLEEVEKKYKRYCEQMQATVSMLESVAGEGAAEVYTTLASKAKSRHFRRLKDGIVGQLKAARMAGEIRDGGGRATTAGMTRGETPRLMLLDQCVRQQKALQQGTAHQQLPWRPQRGLPENAVSILRAWLFEHFLHPYPSDVDKIVLARETGLSRSQVSNWFINARVRVWKPMVEEMYMEETNELDNSNINAGQNPNPKPPSLPTQLLNVDSGSLSSILFNGRAHHVDDESRFLLRPAAPGNADDVGFPTDYSSFAGDSLRKSSVSLTLGLRQEHAGGEIKAPHHRLF